MKAKKNLAEVLVGITGHYPNQEELYDLIKNLRLTKSNAELLISRLKEWDLLDESVKVTNQRKRHLHFSRFFTKENMLRYYNDVPGLFETIGIPCNPDE